MILNIRSKTYTSYKAMKNTLIYAKDKLDMVAFFIKSKYKSKTWSSG